MSTHRTALELRTIGRPFVKGTDPRRNLGGRPATSEELKVKIEALTPEMIDRIALLARSAKKEAVRLEAARYLADRRLGRPTEKIQQELSTVPAVMPSEEQLERLAQRALGDPTPPPERTREVGAAMFPHFPLRRRTVPR